MENLMYERMPLKFKFLDGKGNLVTSLEGCLRLSKPRVICKEIIHARDTRKTKYTMQYIKWTSKLRLLSLIESISNNIYQQ
jgi:hypothetical protein